MSESTFTWRFVMAHIYYLSERQNHRCCYCGHRMSDITKHISVSPDAGTREHVEPKSYGGVGLEENLAVACRQCNELRGNMDYVAFCNLIHKWFKRDNTLRNRWHSISDQERREFKLTCLRVQERQLRGLGKKYQLYADRHRIFMHHNEERIRA